MAKRQSFLLGGRCILLIITAIVLIATFLLYLQASSNDESTGQSKTDRMGMKQQEGNDKQEPRNVHDNDVDDYRNANDPAVAGLEKQQQPMSLAPSASTVVPTSKPSLRPSFQPSVGQLPNLPTLSPTRSPTLNPSTTTPSSAPSANIVANVSNTSESTVTPTKETILLPSYTIDRSKILRIDNTTTTTTHNNAANRTLKEIQLENYRRGVGLMLLIHITHHAGTTFCKKFAAMNGKTPPFACFSGGPSEFPPQLTNLTTGRYIPWDAAATESNIDAIRPYFHMIAWEFGISGTGRRTLSETDWENERLLSVIVIRNPIDRLLAGDGVVLREYGDEQNRTAKEWDEWSKEPRHNNNFALRILSDSKQCCNGKNTSNEFLHMGQDLMKRFTVVLDQDCFDDNLLELASVLNLTYKPTHLPVKSEIPARDRFHNDTLYEYMLEKNTMDLRLYEWSKNLSLVQCNNTAVTAGGGGINGTASS